MRRVLWILAGAVVLLAVTGLIGSGWYYSNQLLPAASPSDPVYEIDVLDVRDDVITLDLTGASEDYEEVDLTTDGIFGFETTSGYLHLTDVVDVSGDRVQRRYVAIEGTAAEDVRGEIQAYAYPDDPGVLGREFDEVVVAGPLGDYPAWRFPADGDDWVVFVHGRGATLAEPLRAVDHVVSSGVNALVITYRNDPDAPASPDGHGHFGDSEWEDLAAAVDWLVGEEDVDDLVLWGYSQGGSVVASYLRRGDVPDEVVGAVLDSPILSMHGTLRLQAMNRGIPSALLGPILASATTISELRSSIDFGRLEHVEAADEFSLPILLFHGRGDTSVPFEPAQKFAAARKELVTFVPYDGDHVRGWNVDNERYLDAVTAFLRGTTEVAQVSDSSVPSGL